MAGNCVALGKVILIAPVQFAFKNDSSCPVSGRTCRSLDVTMPITLLSFAAFPSPVFHERPTASPISKPSTASVKSLMKFRRRSSPSVKISSPSSFCLASTRLICRSSVSCKRFGSFAAFSRASRSSCGRRKLPTWSARYCVGILFVLFSSIWVWGNLYKKLLVDLDPVLPAMTEVMVNEPEDVERIEQIILVVVEFERAIQKKHRL